MKKINFLALYFSAARREEGMVKMLNEIEKMQKEISSFEFSGSWFDPYFPESIEKDLDLIDEISKDSELVQSSDGMYYLKVENEGDFEKVYLNITWYRITAEHCKCSKFIRVIDNFTADFYENTIPYCTVCGRENYAEGIYSVKRIESKKELLQYLSQGYKLSKENKEIIEKIYPNIDL